MSMSSGNRRRHNMRSAQKLFHRANHAINFCARSIAKSAVKEQLRAQGVRLTLVRPAEISARAQVYLEQHPECYGLDRATDDGEMNQAALSTEQIARNRALKRLSFLVQLLRFS